MKTLEQQVEIIEKAIDTIIDVAEDIPVSNTGYLISVVGNLRSLQFKIENQNSKD